MGAPRKFDHDEARRLRGQGWTYQAIGDALGVSDMAVCRVCDETVRAKMDKAAQEWQRQGVCIDCGAPRIRVSKHHEARCRPCSIIAMATSVRDGELCCSTCKQWKPDDDFPFNRSLSVRRQRASQCRMCQTQQKRQWRARNPEKDRAANRRWSRQRRAHLMQSRGESS